MRLAEVRLKVNRYVRLCPCLSAYSRKKGLALKLAQYDRADVATPTPAPALLPFGTNSPLWSDGAIKSRWMESAVKRTDECGQIVSADVPVSQTSLSVSV